MPHTIELCNQRGFVDLPTAVLGWDRDFRHDLLLAGGSGSSSGVRRWCCFTAVQNIGPRGCKVEGSHIVHNLSLFLVFLAVVSPGQWCHHLLWSARWTAIVNVIAITVGTATVDNVSINQMSTDSRVLCGRPDIRGGVRLHHAPLGIESSANNLVSHLVEGGDAHLCRLLLLIRIRVGKVACFAVHS